jgi:hypothetical protein
MNHARRIIVLAAISVFTVAGFAVADDDEIYTCRDVDGNITFQDDPCPEIPETVALPVASAPPPKPEPPIRRPKPATPKPEPKPRTLTLSTATTSWTIVPPDQNPPPLRARSLGKQTFPTRLDPAGPIKSPSFVSPEQTWLTFLAAIETGDRAAAVSCLTPTALEHLGSDLEIFPLEQMRRMVHAFTSIENDGDLGPYWSIHGVRERRHPKWIFFEETTVGEWKISGI